MREFLKVYGLITLVVIVGFVLAFQFVNPAPPKTLTIAAGSAQGAYTAFAQQYAKILARDGITLEIKQTGGSVENLSLLRDPDSEIDVAFMQGGVGRPERDETLVGLGSVYFEPLWVFTRRAGPFAGQVGRLSDLRGKRVAIGGEGSGTSAVALQLLAANSVLPENSEFVRLGGNAAADALRAGEVDAAFFVTGRIEGPLTDLAIATDIDLMDFDQADAYAARFRFLSRTTLPQGAISLGLDVPESSLDLLAPAATLIAKESMHPALIDLLLQAAREVHGAGGLFEAPEMFPSPRYLDFALSSDAKRYYESGTRFLRKYLPFWAATLVERLLVMLLPFFTLLIPLFRIAPPTYRWRIRMKIYKWYEKLREIESDARALKESGGGQDPAGVTQKLDAILTDLEELQDEASRVSVPLAYAEHLYHLRQHIEFVRTRLTRG
ncbi:MAG: TAXI family TRAP transporter solute-binding subunit [Pseudomonadota bacterium]